MATPEVADAQKVTNQLIIPTFFELEACGPVIHALQQCGSCSRCIMRLIGVKRQSLYTQPQQVIAQLLQVSTAGDAPDAKEDEESTRPDGQAEVAASPTEDRACCVCLGILQAPCKQSHVHSLAQEVREADFGFSNFSIAMTLPLQLLIREKSMYLHLKSKFSKLYQKQTLSSIATIKEVYKWVCGPVMGSALDVNFYFKSPMEIMVTFAHKETDREVDTLLHHGKDGEPPRKRKFHSVPANAPGRPMVVEAMKNLSVAHYKEIFACPPQVPPSPCSSTVTCSYSAVFVAGRYNKYSRKLSQTPWFIEGERKTEFSIQEIVCNPLQELFKAADVRFSASGREDVDVRTLGNGRPFVVEILNSRRPIPSQDVLRALQRSINKSTSDVRVRDLQGIDREETNRLKDGEEIKTKSYSALVWSSVEQTAEKLAMLADIKDLKLQQKTPIRVLHRRPLATRERLVHSMSATVIDPHHFRLFLRTQAGTYIKEFVHSDFGRTAPSLGCLLKCEMDILALDVESVDVDWPPSLPDDDGDDEEVKMTT